MKRLAQFFIIVGIFAYLIGMYQVWLRFNPNKLAFSDYQPVVKDTPFVAKALPTRLEIKDRKITVSVLPTNVVNNVWETNDKGASYVLSSPLPGEKGNSVIYAHNWANLFGNLNVLFLIKWDIN